MICFAATCAAREGKRLEFGKASHLAEIFQNCLIVALFFADKTVWYRSTHLLSKTPTAVFRISFLLRLSPPLYLGSPLRHSNV